MPPVPELPPASDLRRFPPRCVATLWLHTIDHGYTEVPGCLLVVNNESDICRWSVTYTVLPPSALDQLGYRLVALTKVRKCWDKLDDCWAVAENGDTELRLREELGRLRLLLGPGRYYQGLMPLP